MRKLLLVIGASVAIATLWAAMASTQTQQSPRLTDDELPCEWPCPGHRYVVVYDIVNGSIVAVDGYDPTDPEEGTLVPSTGQALLDITGFDQLLDLRKNVDAYTVDLATLSLKKEEGIIATSSVAPTPIVTATPNP